MTGSRSRSGRAKADVDFLSRPSSEQKTRGPLPRVLHEARPLVNQLEIMLLQCPHVSRGQLALWVEDRGVLWFSMSICLGFQFCVF